jgi:hypothetical protein
MMSHGFYGLISSATSSNRQIFNQQINPAGLPTLTFQEPSATTSAGVSPGSDTFHRTSPTLTPGHALTPSSTHITTSPSLGITAARNLKNSSVNLAINPTYSLGKHPVVQPVTQWLEPFGSVVNTVQGSVGSTLNDTLIPTVQTVGTHVGRYMPSAYYERVDKVTKIARLLNPFNWGKDELALRNPDAYDGVYSLLSLVFFGRL